MNARKIAFDDVKVFHFTKNDVLGNDEERQERIRKLVKAVVLCHTEHQDIGIVFKLESGEVIETFCDLIDFADDFVVIKGGTAIPLISIVDIEF